MSCYSRYFNFFDCILKYIYYMYDCSNMFYCFYEFMKYLYRCIVIKKMFVCKY